MNPNAPPERQVPRNTWDPADAEHLYRRQLREALGINAAGVEVMQHRETYFEASWQEMVDPEERT